MKPFLLSVYDFTGNWSRPYIEAGWKVLLWDYQAEGCILEGFNRLCDMIEENMNDERITGLIAAPPCSDFSKSGACFWSEKDSGQRWWPNEEGDEKLTQYFKSTTERSVALVLIVLELIAKYDPYFWAIENPAGRIEKLVPELKRHRKITFNPCDYGDPYTKQTVLWGEFNTDLPKKPVEPEFISDRNGNRYSKIHWNTWHLNPHDRKNIRSQTPQGFANAFFQANHKFNYEQKELFNY